MSYKWFDTLLKEIIQKKCIINIKYFEDLRKIFKYKTNWTVELEREWKFFERNKNTINKTQIKNQR